ncbi:MAG: NAD(P)H-dependent oxidoreductase [candidate division KSB1 bacterium]|nr:NAD(P)H-dependent oxidoreductase [candidate division KSB1 bacterium]
MHLYILYAHSGRNTFCRAVLGAFRRGLSDSGHTSEIHDLCRTDSNCRLNPVEYIRETGLEPEAPVPEDIKREHERIAKADALGFIYPLWWSDVAAVLKGWFDRVWTYGYACFYAADKQRTTKINIAKAVLLCSAGHTAKHLETTGIAKSMRQIMIQDRLLGVGVKHAGMSIPGGMMPHDNSYRKRNLETAYSVGKQL